MIFCSVLFSLRFFPAFFCADKPEIQKNVIYAKSIVGRMYARFFNGCMFYNLKLLFIRLISFHPKHSGLASWPTRFNSRTDFYYPCATFSKTSLLTFQDHLQECHYL